MKVKIECALFSFSILTGGLEVENSFITWTGVFSFGVFFFTFYEDHFQDSSR